MGCPFSGTEVFKSPEFAAFCQRFGISFRDRVQEVTIRMTAEALIVTEQYMPFAPRDIEQDRSKWMGLMFPPRPDAVVTDGSG